MLSHFIFPPYDTCNILNAAFGLQSPLGVASGAIVGHLVATSIAVLGGAFLAKYISEKLVSKKVTIYVNGSSTIPSINAYLLFLRSDSLVGSSSSSLLLPLYWESSDPVKVN